MLIALVTDIHGNFSAVQTCHEHIKHFGVDYILSLGDVVGYGPQPNECLEWEREYVSARVPGNHDIAVSDLGGILHKRRPAKKKPSENTATLWDWTAKQLTGENKAYLEEIAHSPLVLQGDNLPDELRGLDVSFSHANPALAKDMAYMDAIYRAKDYCLENSRVNSRFNFVGHVHKPRIYYPGHVDVVERTVEGTQSFEAGELEKALFVVPSVGQPRDGNAQTGFVIVNTDTWEVHYFRRPYPVAESTNLLESIANFPEKERMVRTLRTGMYTI